MCNWKTPLAIGGLMAVAFVAGRALPVGTLAEGAQPEKPKAAQPVKPKTDKPATPAGQPEFTPPKPGPEHRVLDAMIGTWEGGGKMWIAPDQSPIEFKSTAVREWTLDGMWVKETVEGPASEAFPAFKAIGMTGYNTFDKKYEFAWFENVSPWMTTGLGSYDAAKKTFTCTGTMICPITQQRMRTRNVCDMSNPNVQVCTGWATGADGKEFKNFEGTFTKKK